MSEERANLEPLKQLPEEIKREVLDYAEFLLKKYNERKRKKANRKAGSARGKYKLAPDFDAPLEDFREYM